MSTERLEFRAMKKSSVAARFLRTALLIVLCLAMMVFGLAMLAGTTHAAPSRSSSFSSGYSLSGGDPQAIYSVAMAQRGATNGKFQYPGAWCAFFVLDCARLAGIPAGIIPYNDANTGNCTVLYNKMTGSCGAKRVSTPQRGDFVFYYCNSKKTYVHVGIWDGNGYAVEGNVSGQVLYYKSANYKDTHGHTVSSGAITRVYVRPAYRTIGSCDISLSYTKTTYTGAAMRPAVKVTCGTKTLSSGTDYTVTWSQNVNAGTAWVTVTGKGVYSGSQKKSFVIAPKSVAGASVRILPTTRTWTGSQIRPGAYVYFGSTVLRSGTDYTLSYDANRNLGRGWITISGKGNYCGSRRASFYIVPQKVTGVKVTAGLHKLGISWTAPRSGVSGYAVSIKKHSASSWTTYYVSAGRKSCSIGKLTPLVNYDVKVTGYVLVGSLKVTGPASAISTKRPL